MEIKFIPLAESHFPLLLKWLETPHVKAWWDQDIKWTFALIQKKYADYLKGYQLENGVARAIHAYIIYVDNTPIGYIQYYSKHDFPVEQQGARSFKFSKSCAGIDWYIGEIGYTGRGIGSQSLEKFIEEQVFPRYTHIVVDPEAQNHAAISAYNKAGFVQAKKIGNVVWMLNYKQKLRLPMRDMLAMETVFCQSFLKDDSLWIFGSRVDLAKKGGDIDIYIETAMPDPKQAVESKIKFLCDLKEEIGDQKIDVVLNVKSLHYDLPIHQVAKSEGVKII